MPFAVGDVIRVTEDHIGLEAGERFLITESPPERSRVLRGTALQEMAHGADFVFTIYMEHAEVMQPAAQVPENSHTAWIIVYKGRGFEERTTSTLHHTLQDAESMAATINRSRSHEIVAKKKITVRY